MAGPGKSAQNFSNADTPKSTGMRSPAKKGGVDNTVVLDGKGLMITIVSAKGLRNADKTDGSGLSDPFCICMRNRLLESQFRTQTVRDSLNPVWNFAKAVQHYSQGDTLNFSVYDQDEGIKKDLLGSCELPFDSWYPHGCETSLEMTGYGQGHGRDQGSFPTLQVKVEVFGPPREELSPRLREELSPRSPKIRGGFPNSPASKMPLVEGKGLVVTCISASNLPNRDLIAGQGLSDPFVHVEIPNRGSQFKTHVVWNNLEPVWNFTGQLLVYHPGDPIKFVVWDKDDKKSSMGDMLGKAELLYDDYCSKGVEGRLKLPAKDGRKPAYLSIKVEVWGPPEGPIQKVREKKLPEVEQRARETKHIFLEWLKHRRGCSYRAWRLDVDTKNTNKVSYTDLMESCRHLGLSLKESRLLWRAFRPAQGGCPATPLEFHEFDPIEWANMNELLEVLWREVNFDLDLVWTILDPKEKGWVNFEEFKLGLSRVSFDGDVRLIFVGLDTSGQGRLWRQELEALKLFSPESHSNPEDSPCVQQFKAWVLRRYGPHSLQSLLHDLGMKTGGSMVTVRKFSERLARLRCDSDPLHTAMALSRCNVTISVDDVMEVLGKARQQRESLSYAGRKCVFKPAQRQKQVTDNETEKPPWDGTIYDPTRLNLRLGIRERHYFSRPFDRPLREEIHAHLEDKTGWKVVQEGDRGEFFSKQDRRRRHQGMASRHSYLEMAEDASLPASARDPASKIQKSAQTRNLRVYLLGCTGLAEEDEPDGVTVTVTCEVEGRSGEEVGTSPDFQCAVEREATKPNYENVGDVTAVKTSDCLQFAFFMQDEEEEDVCFATAILPAQQIFPKGFDGGIDMQDDDGVVEGAKFMVRVEVLDADV